MNYKVGQIIFVVLRKEASVYPMQVIEEIVKKTLEGEVTSYMVRAGADRDKVLSVSEIDGEIFDSAEKAKKILVDRVSQTISNRVDHAIKKAKEWYPAGFESAVDDPLSMIKKSGIVQESEKQLQPETSRRQISSEVAELAAEFSQEAEATMIELPGGIKAKVNSVKLPKELQG